MKDGHCSMSTSSVAVKPFLPHEAALDSSDMGSFLNYKANQMTKSVLYVQVV